MRPGEGVEERVLPEDGLPDGAQRGGDLVSRRDGDLVGPARVPDVRALVHRRGLDSLEDPVEVVVKSLAFVVPERRLDDAHALPAGELATPRFAQPFVDEFRADFLREPPDVNIEIGADLEEVEEVPEVKKFCRKLGNVLNGHTRHSKEERWGI